MEQVGRKQSVLQVGTRPQQDQPRNGRTLLLESVPQQVKQTSLKQTSLKQTSHIINWYKKWGNPFFIIVIKMVGPFFFVL